MAPKVVTGVVRGFEESQNQRDARVEALWAKLDPGQSGELDLKGLKKGFRSMDHRELPSPHHGGRRRLLMLPTQRSRMPTSCWPR